VVLAATPVECPDGFDYDPLYEVHFDGVEYDGSSESTFTYTVCAYDGGESGCGLSHWELELCIGSEDGPYDSYVEGSCDGYGLPGDTVDGFPDDGSVDGYDCEIRTEGTPPAEFGFLKWEPSGDLLSDTFEGACDRFTFKLLGDWTGSTDLDDSVAFRVKSGIGCTGGGAEGSTCTGLPGPACEGSPTAVTLSSFCTASNSAGHRSWPYVGLAGVALAAVGLVARAKGKRR
jgi:hypothetical protein